MTFCRSLVYVVTHLTIVSGYLAMNSAAAEGVSKVQVTLLEHAAEGGGEDSGKAVGGFTPRPSRAILGMARQIDHALHAECPGWTSGTAIRSERRGVRRSSRTESPKLASPPWAYQ